MAINGTSSFSKKRQKTKKKDKKKVKYVGSIIGR